MATGFNQLEYLLSQMTATPRINAPTQTTVVSITPDNPAYHQLLVNSTNFVSDPKLREWANGISSGEPPVRGLAYSSRTNLLSAIASRKEEIESMWQRLQGLIYTLASLEFLAAPIRQLPSELLWEIFSQLAPTFSPLPGGIDERTDLRLVCKRWNEVVPACAPLWSHWKIDGMSQDHPLWINETEWKANGPANLNLTVQAGRFLEKPDWPKRANAIKSRVVTLRIIRNTPDLWHRGLNHLLAGGLPHLVELDITETLAPNTLSPDSPSFEALQILTLRSGYPPFPLLAPRLRELRLIDFDLKSRGSVEVFRGCMSTISKLVVSGSPFSQDWENVPQPSFPALAHLEIDSMAILAWVSRGVTDLQRVHFPSLAYYDDPNEMCAEDFTPMPSVKTIILDDLRFLHRRSGLLNAAMPMTRQIISTVDGRFCREIDTKLRTPNRLLDLQIYPGSTTHQFPRLEQLEISVKDAAADSIVILNTLFPILYQRYRISCGEWHHTRQPTAECKVSIHWQGEASIIDVLPKIQDATHRDLKNLYYEDLPEEADESISDVTDNSYATEFESDSEPEAEDSDDNAGEDDGEVGDFGASPVSLSFPREGAAVCRTEVIDPQATSQEVEDTCLLANLANWNENQSIHSDDDDILTDTEVVIATSDHGPSLTHLLVGVPVPKSWLRGA